MISPRSILAVLVAASAVMAPAEDVGTTLIARLTTIGTGNVVAKKYGLGLVDRTVGAPFALFQARSAAQVDAIQARMAGDPLIVWVEDNAGFASPESLAGKQKPMKGGGVPAVGDRTALTQINSNFLGQVGWDAASAAEVGRSVRVAILDNGLSPRQTALWAKVDASANFVEPKLPAFDQPMGQDSNHNRHVDDAVGHGTMVTGLIDVASPQSRFVIVRVADSDGSATAWTLVKGLAFAATSGAEVVNVSLGTLTPVAAMSDVLEWCDQQKMLVVAAIGNDAVRAACYPARLGKAICVAGLDADNFKASFSNWDGTADVCAPAVGLASQFWDGGLVTWSGTSFAVPFVTAAAAELARHSSGRLSSSTLRSALSTWGDSIDSLNPSYKKQLGLRLNFTRLLANRP